MRLRMILHCCGFLLVESWCCAADRPFVDLTGAWEFKIDPLDVGRTEKWFDPNVPYDRKIDVPGAWNAQGVAFQSQRQLRAYEDRRLEEQKDLNKRGMLGSERESNRLFHAYPGPAWYRMRVSIPADWKGKIPWLVFTGVHREAEVWVDGKPAGSHRSYLTPLRIDLSQPPISAQAGDTVTIAARVDARRNREVDPLMGCLDTLDFLYVTWGGLHQSVRLEAATPTRVDDVFVVPRLKNETAEIRVSIARPRSGKLKIVAQVFDQDGALVKSADQTVAPETPETALAVQVANPKVWSPKSPYLYTARISLFSEDAAVDQRTVRFGMREFKVAGGKFLLNGKPIFLRGYGDDCIFPNTICPPSDKNELRARLALAHAYGFNFARHHSWMPPEAYLDAADELGMMLQPEFPFAYAWDLPTSQETRRAALEQWQAVIRINRNHPSIVAWCMGNEQYNSFDIAPAMNEAARRLDPTRPIIDSDGCSFKHATRESLDYLVVQFGEGNSIGHQDRKYDIPAAIAKPVIGHEMGYFVTLPDLAQIDRFKGGLRPYWLQQTRDLATKNGSLAAYPDWLAASYRLQAVCLKSNLEAARRSRLGGTSVWLFQDYPNCAEGVVGMFGQAKGLSAEEFRKFNAPTVLLLDIPRRNWWSDETAELTFVVSRCEDAPSRDATLRWRLHNGDTTIAQGEQSHLAIRSGEVQELPTIKVSLRNLARPSKLTISAELTDADADAKAVNSWDLWVFPRVEHDDLWTKVRSVGFEPIRTLFPNTIEHRDGPISSDTGLLVATQLDEKSMRYLEEGGRVFLLDPEQSFAVEPTNFRLSSWDGGGPSGTIVNLKHLAMSDFPSEGWCDLQFYSLIQKSKTIVLSALPAKIEPLVRCIDRPTRLADRTYLFEVSIGRGNLLVSGFNFQQALKSGDPAAVFLFDRLVRYALGSDFKPRESLPVDLIRMKGAKVSRPRGAQAERKQ
jgi:beta-galactosidase